MTTSERPADYVLLIVEITSSPDVLVTSNTVKPKNILVWAPGIRHSPEAPAARRTSPCTLLAAAPAAAAWLQANMELLKCCPIMLPWKQCRRLKLLNWACRYLALLSNTMRLLWFMEVPLSDEAPRHYSNACTTKHYSSSGTTKHHGSSSCILGDDQAGHLSHVGQHSTSGQICKGPQRGRPAQPLALNAVADIWL